MLYDHLHLGMRSHDDAARLIRTWQGKRISLVMKLPKLFVDRVGIDFSMTEAIVPTTITIITDKLYLDYADVQLPKGRLTSGTLRNNSNINSNPSTTTNNSSNNESSTRTRGQSSRSECTSATSHVDIPGLHLVPQYVTEREEQIMMAALTGPHAPWAPRQYAMSGGMIRRRVQHYGYVFDYESADVLRRDDEEEDDGGGEEKRACPPLPSMDARRQDVVEMTDGEVERKIDEAVEDVRGWEALAGVIERTRRVDCCASSTSSSSSSSSGGEKVEEKMNDASLDGGGCASSNGRRRR